MYLIIALRLRFALGLFCSMLLAGHYLAVIAQGPAVPKETPATPETKSAGNIKVTFDETAPGVVFIEANGERIRVDTNQKSIARVDEPATTTAPVAAPTAAAPVTDAKIAQGDDEELDEPGLEPYDYRLVQVPTPKRYAKGSLTLYFTHRFTQPIRPFRGDDGSAKALFGLDTFSASAFGLYYGISDKLYVNAYRSPLCRNGHCRTIEIGAGYNALHEKKGKSPVSLGFYGSIEGNDNFTEEYTYNLQTMIARSVGPRVNVFFAPALHLNTNGQRRFNPRPGDFSASALVANRFDPGTHTASFGFGVNARIRPTVSLLFDYTPRTGFKQGRIEPIFDTNFNVTGFKNKSHAALGFGVQKDTARHTFSLTFGNTQTTTTSSYNSSNLVLSPKNWVIGFNLARRLLK